MAEPEADRDDIEEAFGGPVVTGGDPSGVLQRVEATFDEVAQTTSRSPQPHRVTPKHSGQSISRLHL